MNSLTTGRCGNRGALLFFGEEWADAKYKSAQSRDSDAYAALVSRRGNTFSTLNFRYYQPSSGGLFLEIDIRRSSS